MASFKYDEKGRKARFFFRFAGKQFNKTLAMESARHAERLQAAIEETIQDLERGKRTLPEDSDVLTFIMSGGKLATKPKPAVSNPVSTPAEIATVASVFDTYAETLTPGSKESNSMVTEAIHGRHFKRLLGAKQPFEGLALNALQRYVDKRAKEGVVRATIHKELSTLRVVWKWAATRGHVRAALTWEISDLTLPKAHERPPFQTWEQITRKIERGGLTEAQVDSLWECLWLDQAQTTECLEWARAKARQPFLYPMFAMAAYTGARRSEIIRSEIDDWDFNGRIVTIRQKKADKTKKFTRRNVPILAPLADVMHDWFKNHPGGSWTFCTDDGRPITPDAASSLFRATVDGGKWSVLHGWHTFRHSLASNMASAGVDQRMINEILGHSTEEMERRYRHLLPQKQEDALNALFQAPATP